MKQPEDHLTLSLNFVDDVEQPLERKIKIIFLDFDGVICNPGYSFAHGCSGHYDLIEPRAGLLVQKLCEGSGAKVVISSSWRLGRDLQSIGDILGAAIPQLRKHLLQDGSYWRTGNGPDRQAEIKGWLRYYQEVKGVEVEQYVILDDDNLIGDPLLYDPEIKARWVKTNGYDGMGLTNYFEAESILRTGTRADNLDKNISND